MSPFSWGSREVSWEGHGEERSVTLPPTHQELFPLLLYSLQSKIKAFCFIWFLALTTAPKSLLSWWLWVQLLCFCNLDITGNLLSTELSVSPAYKAQAYFTRAAEASL